MNYELAKELFEGGFPMKPIRPAELTPEKITETTTEVLIKETVRWPNLSELIEACGEHFDKLERVTNFEEEEIEWRAYKITGNWENAHYPFGFETPEEAVARLWLALNKK